MLILPRPCLFISCQKFFLVFPLDIIIRKLNGRVKIRTQARKHSFTANARTFEVILLFVISLALLVGVLGILGGMKIMRHGLQAFAGSHLRRLLIWITQTPSRGFLSGILLTALLQSSTALTVMSVSFVDAGLLSLENTLALILGSNIGTTVTTQLLAFPLHQLAVILLPVSTIGYVWLRSRFRFFALALSGLSLLFCGIALLQSLLSPLAETPLIQNYLHSLGDHHLRGILAGTLLSALLHSSSATTGIVMLLLSEGWLTLPTAFCFVLGANIGTCFTAVAASLASSPPARKVAVFHVLLNVFGVLLFFPWIQPLSRFITWFDGNPARQVAHAHTIFNLASSLIVLPFLSLIVRWLPPFGQNFNNS